MQDYSNFRVWIEISKQKLNDNIVEIRKTVDPAGVFVVLKANAYGLGAVEVAQSIDTSLIDGICVANFDEAEHLLHLNNSIHILGVLTEFEIKKAIENDIVITIVSLESALIIDKIASSLNKIAECHIKVDTGMGRLGVLYEEALEVIEKITELRHTNCTGIFSHFPNAFNLNNFTLRQIDVFKRLIYDLELKKIRFKKVHFANSDANNNYSSMIKASPFNYVRTGLNIYGFVDSGSNKNIKLEPVFTIKSRLLSIKKLPKGFTIGYGSNYILQKDTWIGVISIGYADGLPLNLSNRGYVIVNDVLCPIIGRVSMDYTTISLDTCNVSELNIGQEVICVGKTKNHSITLESWAQIKGTHPYDIICSLGQRIKRVFY